MIYEQYIDVPVGTAASTSSPIALSAESAVTVSPNQGSNTGERPFVRVHILGGDKAPESESLSSTAKSHSDLDSVCLFLLHGAGSSALTWHYLVRLFQGNTYAPVLILAPDLRGHGSSSPAKTMSLSDLTNDVFCVLDTLRGVVGSRKVVLIGHSLGGSIVARVAASRREEDNIAGVVVLDVAEETVISSFKSLEDMVGRWPAAFASPEDYVRWTVAMRRPSSSHSAAISTTDHLVPDIYGRFRMKFNLLEWKDSWVDWFRGFDATFMSLGVPSLLIMAHYDNLDTDLAVGHMQGRFECQIMSSPLRSHFMQEDSPDELFNMLLTFLRKRGFVSMDGYHLLVVAGRRNRIFV